MATKSDIKSIRLTTRFNKTEVKHIDNNRGKKTRSEYIRNKSLE
jgi:hypothetical protein